ncbi:histidine kinase N-terminal 7TM domain-containing protein [Patescibacteria group bacterium]
MEIVKCLDILAAIVYITLTILVIKKRKPTRAYRRYIGFIISGALWVIIGVFESSNLRFNPESNLLISKIDFALASLISYFIALFALHFPRENIKLTKKFEILLFIPILIAIFLSVSGKIFGYNEGELIYSFTPYFIYFTIIFIYFIPLALFVFIKKFRSSEGIIKIQLQYIILGYLISIAAGLLLSAFFAINTRGTFYFGIAYIITLAFAFGSTYAMIRYRFLDIRLALQKGVVQLLTFGILFGIYTYVILLFQQSVRSNVDISSKTTLLIAVLIIVITIEPLRRLIYRKVDKLFSSKENENLRVLERVRLASNSTSQFGEMVERVITEIKAVFGRDVSLFFENERKQGFIQLSGNQKIDSSDPIYLYLKLGRVLVAEELPYRIEEGDDSLQPILENMKSNKLSLIMPIGSGDDLLGAFVFTNREKAKTFSSDEIQLIKKFSDQITIPFANALAYKHAVERITSK